MVRLKKAHKYFIRRTILFVIIMLIALFINFTIPRFAPGNPIGTVIAMIERQGSRFENIQEVIDTYETMFGLKGSIPEQFVRYLSEISKGNLGYSIRYFPVRVSTLLGRALPFSIFLLGVSTAISWALGTVIGLFAGWKSESRLSKTFSYVALILNVVPYYMLALVLIFLLAYVMAIFPFGGAYAGTLKMDWTSIEFIKSLLYHSFLPSLSIVITSLGWWFLSIRSLIVDLKGEDFILLAEAKGLKESRIMWKHAFRNALLPQLTMLALSLGGVVNGSLLTEMIFSYPGLGLLLFESIATADYTVIQGITLIITLSVGFATFIIDALYPLVDPRITYEER